MTAAGLTREYSASEISTRGNQPFAVRDETFARLRATDGLIAWAINWPGPSCETSSASCCLG
ncbi:hypothetical protein ACT16_05340 [Mycobacterium heckeshornense]|uniref:Uncharacterized protein n=1 Tax=Mycobacterium heckeshornense TaxID=110505 RepID=A0A2I3ESX2_9MYCO|nr:hypothetical protein ACT16_05340 [Mycobacterium heckeshornense]BCO38263.1 hypothetical protein MHEC_46960 [Mycobacterium heckeshornense]